MLDLMIRQHPHHPMSRRELIRVGMLGLGGLTLADQLRFQSLAGTESSVVKKRSVIFLFLAGGPSQYETFDPNPEGAETHRSINGSIATSLTGVRFSSYLPKLAKQAHRLSIVKSFQTNHSEHNGAHKQLLTADLTVKDGQEIREPGLGAIYARMAGPMNRATGMPRHLVIPPTTRYPGAGKGFAGAFESVIEGIQPATLGTTYAPIPVQVPMASGLTEAKPKTNKKPNSSSENTGDDFLQSLQLKAPVLQFQDRLTLLKELDDLNRQVQGSAAHQRDAYRQQALDLLSSGAIRKAFDLTLEDPATLKAYDTEHFRNWQCDDQSRFQRNTPSIGFSLGRQLLLARRLCEAGAGFVTVVNANWDFHARKGIPNIPEGMGVFGPPLDHAVSAFLDDLHQRGLEREILLVITGEFGRSGMDKNAGRHHHPRICPLVFAGGGLNHGQVIGKSDARAAAPATNPITIDDLHATLYHSLLDVAQLRTDTDLSSKLIDRLSRGKPVTELFQ
ncbi:MAG: DUF1501 domain-containing protein [Zavarzinella sp.]